MRDWQRGARAVFLAIAMSGFTHGHAQRPTESCNPRSANQLTLESGDATLITQLAATVARPAADPDLFSRLWHPLRASTLHFPLFGRYYLNLQYDESQDLEEVLRTIRADDRLAGSIRLGYLEPHGCLPVVPAYRPPLTAVSEFVNTRSGHFRLAGSNDEVHAVESGAAGDGWQPTGEVFTAFQPGYGACLVPSRVYRFRSETGSTFLTTSPDECGALRKRLPGWSYVDVAFWAAQAWAGQCPAWAPRPVYRIYNGRWRENDSNHRYVARPELYREMLDKGWIAEGVAFCVVEEVPRQWPDY